MSRMLRVLLQLGVLLWMTPSHGQTSCLPEFTSLQAFETVSAAQPRALKYPLLAERPDGRFATKAILAVTPSSQEPGRLALRVLFDPAFNGVSLPYNLYAVQVLLNGEVAYWLDFTRGCHGPGLSFFPGREIPLPEVKLIGEKPQALQIMVWGKL